MLTDKYVTKLVCSLMENLNRNISKKEKLARN